MSDHTENSKEFPSLEVRAGASSESQNINPAFFRRGQTALPSVGELTKGILEGNVPLLSRAITLVESRLKEHQQIASQVIEACHPYAGKSIRIGVSGVPGVGKSTFLDAFVPLFSERGHKVVILAVDPSSERSKGSILGDKTRMQRLNADTRVYVRPSPAAGSLGGVARKTRESIILCEAAGYDIVFVETVGVGQNETAVHGMIDFFLLLAISGAGDELQGVKKGIMEMATAIAVNKADGDNIAAAELAKRQLQNALRLFPAPASSIAPQVFTCSSYMLEGLKTIQEYIFNYIQQTRQSGYFDEWRREQSRYWLYETIREQLLQDFFENPAIKEELPKIEARLNGGKVTPFTAADRLLAYHHSEKSSK